MGGGSAPAPPDYAAAAKEQGQQNQTLNQQQTAANRPNIITPWGSQTWTQTGGTVDHAGYDAAVKAWQSKYADLGKGGDGVDQDGNPINTSIDYNKVLGAVPTEEQFATGPSWQQNVTLTPAQQQALDAEQQITAGKNKAALGLVDQASAQFANPMDWSSLPSAGKAVQSGSLQTSVDGPNMQTSLTNSAGDWRQKAQDAVTQMQAPDLAQRRAAMETQLSNQGLTPGSEAWNNSMRRVGDDETRANLAAISAGRDEAGQLFQQDLQSGQFGNDAQAKQLTGDIAAGSFGNQAHAQEFDQQLRSGAFDNELRKMGISEEQLRRGMTLNELNALMSGGQVATPSFASAPTAQRAAGTDLVGAATNQYQGMVDSYNADQARSASNTQAAGTAAMMAAMYAFSDRRLKKDIEWLGLTLKNGIKLYKYRFIGSDRMEIGVIAQEVEKIMPKAVTVDSRGYLMVDYAQVLK